MCMSVHEKIFKVQKDGNRGCKTEINICMSYPSFVFLISCLTSLRKENQDIGSKLCEISID